MTRARVYVVAVAATLLLSLSNSATATDGVSVSFRASVAGAQEIASCDVNVLSGDDGIDVLDAAVESGCISSYKATVFPFGTFVDCINEICGRGEAIFVGSYWSLLIDGEPALVGVDGFNAGANQAIAFDYQTYYFLPV